MVTYVATPTVLFSLRSFSVGLTTCFSSWEKQLRFLCSLPLFSSCSCGSGSPIYYRRYLLTKPRACGPTGILHRYKSIKSLSSEHEPHCEAGHGAGARAVTHRGCQRALSRSRRTAVITGLLWL